MGCSPIISSWNTCSQETEVGRPDLKQFSDPVAVSKRNISSATHRKAKIFKHFQLLEWLSLYKKLQTLLLFMYENKHYFRHTAITLKNNCILSFLTGETGLIVFDAYHIVWISFQPMPSWDLKRSGHLSSNLFSSTGPKNPKAKQNNIGTKIKVLYTKSALQRAHTTLHWEDQSHLGISLHPTQRWCLCKSLKQQNVTQTVHVRHWKTRPLKHGFTKLQSYELRPKPF